jgi:hypothetical protein
MEGPQFHKTLGGLVHDCISFSFMLLKGDILTVSVEEQPKFEKQTIQNNECLFPVCRV